MRDTPRGFRNKWRLCTKSKLR